MSSLADTKGKEFGILYHCDRTRCENCHKACMYTTDLKFAKNWDREPTDEERRELFTVIWEPQCVNRISFNYVER